MSLSKVVAKRYQIWVDKFSELVTEKQKEINKISELEPLYIIAKDVMEEANIKNDNKIALYGDSVFVNVNLVKEDKISSFYPIADHLRREFERKRIDLLSKANVYFSATNNEVGWRYVRKFKDRQQSLYLRLFLPYDGTNEIKVVRRFEERRVMDHVTNAFWIGQESSVREDLDLKFLPKELETTKET